MGSGPTRKQPCTYTATLPEASLSSPETKMRAINPSQSSSRLHQRSLTSLLSITTSSSSKMLLLLLLLLQGSSGVPYYPYQQHQHYEQPPTLRQSLPYGAPCMWQGPDDPCDTAAGLSCPYTPSPTCSCWDPRNTFSAGASRCVGKAGEPCTSFPDSPDRLCTHNAYCLQQADTSSSRPTCVCLKGYFRSDNGTCVKYAKHAEPCQSFSPRILCEPETGLSCSPASLTCVCGDNDDQQYDKQRELCISKAGQRCSRTLNNCVENAKCDEKMWGFDYETGDTKIIGYRCACREGLKVTYHGLCASDYGGPCNKSKDCYSDESLSCLNGVCQCHPLSQSYDKTSRRCYNLVGSECPPPAPSSNSTSPPPPPPTGSQNSSTSSKVGAKCTPNAQCLPYPPPMDNSSSSSTHTCQCVSGSSETSLRTCLLDYNEPCVSSPGGRLASLHVLSRTYVLLNSLRDALPQESLKCNVFAGLICEADAARCLCADPSLSYSPSSRSCVAKVGAACGAVGMELLDLEERVRGEVWLGCEEGASCVEGRGRKGVCAAEEISYLETSGGGRRGVKGSLLASHILLNNKVINDVE